MDLKLLSWAQVPTKRNLIFPIYCQSLPLVIDQNLFTKRVMTQLFRRTSCSLIKLQILPAIFIVIYKPKLTWKSWSWVRYCVIHVSKLGDLRSDILWVDSPTVTLTACLRNLSASSAVWKHGSRSLAFLAVFMFSNLNLVFTAPCSGFHSTWDWQKLE